MDRAPGGSYGLVVPDLLGCTAMGDTLEEALAHLDAAMSDWLAMLEENGEPIPEPRTVAAVLADPIRADDVKSGSVVMLVNAVRRTRRAVRANLTLDSGVLAAIDAAAQARRVSRSSMVELLATQALAQAV